MEPRIIYEDSDVLVIAKPAGLIVHSDGRTAEDSVAEWVAHRYPQMKGVGEPWTSPQGEIIDRPGIVHRLDRTTSGVMILAKNKEAHAFLKEQFQQRTIEKEYLTYVYGHPAKDAGTIEAEIRRTRSTPPRWTAEPGGSKKRMAVTEWSVVKRGVGKGTGEKVSLLSVRPRTGRTHQIRVHLKALHHAIVGDTLYASRGAPLLGFTRPALHASSLTLMLPSGTHRTFTAELPEDFHAAEQDFLAL